MYSVYYFYLSFFPLGVLCTSSQTKNRPGTLSHGTVKFAFFPFSGCGIYATNRLLCRVIIYQVIALQPSSQLGCHEYREQWHSRRTCALGGGWGGWGGVEVMKYKATNEGRNQSYLLARGRSSISAQAVCFLTWGRYPLSSCSMVTREPSDRTMVVLR